MAIGEEDVWLATNEGLIHILDHDTSVYSRTNSPILTYNLLTVELDPAGRVWFGDGNQGLVIFDGENWFRLTRENSQLPGNSVLDIVFEDTVVWLACGARLARFAPGDTTVFDVGNSPLPGQSIVALDVVAPDDLWLATFGGGVLRRQQSQWTVYSSANSTIRNNSIFDVTHDHDGFVWIGEGGGLDRFNGQSWVNYNALNSPLPQNDVTALAVGKNGLVWMGMYEGGVAAFDGKSWSAYNPENSAIPSLQVLSIFVDGDDRVWVGTPLGLAVYP